VGEGTVWYLYSSRAVPAILNFNPTAKFIVGIRNPLEMASAMHSTEVMVGHETEKSFERAWELQFERKEGREIPAKCTEPMVLYYGDICSTGKQLNRLFSLVKRENAFVYLFDDLKKNPRKVYKSILEFLNLPDDERTEFPILNPHRKVMSKRVSEVVNTLSRKIDVGPLKKKLGIQTGGGLFRAIKKINTKIVKRDPLSASMKNELWQFFSEDVGLLEGLLNKDLQHWNPNR
jgi:hypothetical protein